MQSSKTTADSTAVALMRILKFSSKDLDANRDGVLTKGQKQRVWRWQLIRSILIWGVALWLASPLTQAQHVVGWSFSEKAVLYGWAALILLIIVGAFWFQRKTFRVLASGKVDSSHGPMNRRISYGKTNSYYIGTPEKSFDISYKVYTAFCDGEEYSLYYLPEIDYLLAAEHHPRAEVKDPVKPLTKRSGKNR